MEKNSKRSMTLLEIMLVISMIAMLGSLLAFQGKDLLETYGFRQEVGLLTRRLALARHYAASYRADVEVVFSTKDHLISCELRSDEPYLRKHPMFSTPVIFKKIKTLSIAGSEDTLDTLLFSGTGWMFPIVNIEVHSAAKKEQHALLPLKERFEVITP